MVDAVDELERGRESYARRAWTDAYKSLVSADQEAPLGAEDLEMLATSAYMTGRDEDYWSPPTCQATAPRTWVTARSTPTASWRGSTS